MLAMNLVTIIEAMELLQACNKVKHQEAMKSNNAIEMAHWNGRITQLDEIMDSIRPAIRKTTFPRPDNQQN